MSAFQFLVVDDEEDIVELFQSLLEEKYPQCKVHKAFDGQSAKTMSMQFKYDCILTDNNMPHLSGPEFLEKIRSKDELNESTPVMLISGYEVDAKIDPDVWEDVYLIQKPVNIDQFHFIPNFF
jgi:CheY-like chemotaxis protein